MSLVTRGLGGTRGTLVVDGLADLVVVTPAEPVGAGTVTSEGLLFDADTGLVISDDAAHSITADDAATVETAVEVFTWTERLYVSETAEIALTAATSSETLLQAASGSIEAPTAETTLSEPYTAFQQESSVNEATTGETSTIETSEGASEDGSQ